MRLQQLINLLEQRMLDIGDVVVENSKGIEIDKGSFRPLHCGSGHMVLVVDESDDGSDYHIERS